MRPHAAAALAGLIFTALAAAQNAQLRGRITDAVTHQPVAGVHVDLTSGGRFTGTLSGADGTYAFGDLSPGPAAFTISLDNYRMIFAGRDKEAWLTLGPGESATRNFEMHPLGRIYGKLIDRDTGMPVEDHAVTALRKELLPGHAAFLGRPVSASRGGGFDIHDLEPGDYLIGIESQEEPKILAEPGKYHPGKLYGQRWYPNVPRRDMATPVHIAEGESRSVDLTLQNCESHTLSGVFEVPPEFAGQTVSLRLDTPDINGPLNRAIELRPGPFRVENLAPGPYRLVFTAGKKVTDTIALRSDEAAADYDFEITDHDIEAVRVVLQPGAGVSGTVRMLEDDAPLPANAHVSLLTTDGWFARLRDGGSIVTGMALIRSVPVQSGAFHQEPIRPGEYWPMIVLPDGYAVSDVLFPGAKSRFDSLTLTAAETPLTFVLTSHPGSIAGTVEGGGASTVILLPDPVPDKLTPAALQVAYTGSDGAFLFRNLAPGHYKAIAVTDAKTAHQSDVGWLRGEAAKADAIEVRASQPTTVTLKP